MKYDFTPISDAAAVAEQSQRSVIRLLVQALEQLERRVRDLEDDYDNAKPKSEDVISDALEFERNVLSVIECNSGSVYSHIEAEIEGKLEDMTQSYDFAAAVEEAVKGSIVGTVEEIIEDRISVDLLEGDAEDIVRKGLRAIL